MKYSPRREPWWNAVKRARSKRARAASQDAAVVTLRLPAFRLPFFLREEKSKWRVGNRDSLNSQLARHVTPTRIALRGRDRSHPPPPRQRGRGTTGAREASEPW